MERVGDQRIQACTFSIRGKLGQRHEISLGKAHEMQPHDAGILTRALIRGFFDGFDDALAQTGWPVRAQDQAEKMILGLDDATSLVPDLGISQNLPPQLIVWSGVQQRLPIRLCDELQREILTVKCCRGFPAKGFLELTGEMPAFCNRLVERLK